jgi:hypothetical protein
MAMTQLTLLPELYLPSRTNAHWHESGIDSLELCLDRAHFLSFPHKVEYQYNSRGFRDAEWPNDLSNVIWCVGDSFTVGIGSPREHTWSYVLQQRTGRRTINVSMDGASNNWIARSSVAILKQFPAATMAVHWSFLHRRELDWEPILESKFRNFYNAVRDPIWPDCNSWQDIEKLPEYIKSEILNVHRWTDHVVYGDERLTQHKQTTVNEDIINTQQCIAHLPNHVVHTAIPNWAPSRKKLNFNNVIQTQQLDYARDRYHYDILTSNALVDKIIPALALNAMC